MTGQEEDHLPIYGPGPLYVGTIALLTVVGIAFSIGGILPFLNAGPLTLPLRVLGGLLVAGGVALWIAAVFGARIDDGIEANRLVTTGVYGIVRNPIYSAFTIVCTGALLICGNPWLLVLPLVFWAFMTMLMKTTEEKWLLDLYGEEYAAYCRRVNRCIPWFPKRDA